MENKKVIAVDLGGTNIRAGLVSSSGQVSDFINEPSLTSLGLRQSLKKLTEVLAEMLRRHPDVAGIGIGIPGAIDYARGVVTESPNLPGWINVELRKILSEKFNVPVYMDNDANVYTLGEWSAGAGRGFDSMACLTLGTGVGGGLILDGRLYRGVQGMASEIGHLAINPRGPLCTCGSRGCLETYASAQALARMAGDEMRRIADEKLRSNFKATVKREGVPGLTRLAENGDATAKKIFARMGYYLGVGLASLNNLLNLDMIVLGGGVSRASDLFLPAALEEIESRCFAAPAKRLQVKRGLLGDNAGLAGAAFLVNRGS
jgi:glucokinase